MISRWRYRFVVGLIWIAVLTAALAGWFYARTSGPAYGPVIIVSIESLRADHLPDCPVARKPVLPLGAHHRRGGDAAFATRAEHFHVFHKGLLLFSRTAR